MTPPLIRISQLSKGYVRGGQAIPVLVDIHLEVAQVGDDRRRPVRSWIVESR
jgi:hypothetical protein